MVPISKTEIILHIETMLGRLEPEALRAVYMVVRELDNLTRYKFKIS